MTTQLPKGKIAHTPRHMKAKLDVIVDDKPL